MPKRTRDHRSALLEDLKEDRQMAAYYLTAALEESNEVFLRALRDVAEAHKISKIAAEAGRSRESLYRTLSEKGNPELSTLRGVLHALKLKIVIETQAPEGISRETKQAPAVTTGPASGQIPLSGGTFVGYASAYSHGLIAISQIEKKQLASPSALGQINAAVRA